MVGDAPTIRTNRHGGMLYKDGTEDGDPGTVSRGVEGSPKTDG